MLFWAPGALFVEIRENCHGNCLVSRAPSFQNDGLQGSSDLWGPPISSHKKLSNSHRLLRPDYLTSKEQTGKIFSSLDTSHSLMTKVWKLINILVSVDGVTEDFLVCHGSPGPHGPIGLIHRARTGVIPIPGGGGILRDT